MVKDPRHLLQFFYFITLSAIPKQLPQQQAPPALFPAAEISYQDSNRQLMVLPAAGPQARKGKLVFLKAGITQNNPVFLKTRFADPADLKPARSEAGQSFFYFHAPPTHLFLATF
jgi:hypothetical protein